MRKDVPIFQVKGSPPALTTLPVFRIVLHHTEASGQRLIRRSVSTKYNKKLTPGGLKTRSGGINIKMRGRYFALQIRIQIGADAILQ